MEQVEYRKKVSTIFYFSRVIAIIAVAVAHTPFHKAANPFLVHIVDTFACLGVALFFFSSGYYFKAVGGKERVLKTCSLLAPWILFGSLGYFISALTNGFQVLAYLKWIVGWNSYLWFMTIYIIMNFLFEAVQCLKNEKLKEKIYVFFFLVMIISRILMPIFNISGAIAFFNLFNWLGFFALGRWIQTKQIHIFFEKNGAISRVVISSALLVIFFLLDYIFDAPIGYFGYTAVFEQLCWIGLLLSVGALWENPPIVISHIGKNTLPIYLIHIAPLQWVCAQFPILIGIYIPLSIVLVVILFYILYIGLLIVQKLKVDKLYEKLIGFKV